MDTFIYDIKNLTHRYRNGAETLNIDALQIQRGAVLGLAGPNGSGKSTLLKVMAYLEPYSGSILFNGEESLGRETEIRRSVTYLLQDSYLLKRTVYENIAYGLKLRGISQDISKICSDSMLKVGLNPKEFANRKWYELSGGEVQRAALASRLALRPKVLLLDEPTANVDEASAQLVKEAAISAWKDWGTTVVVATHDLPWLCEAAADIVSLYKGRIVGRGTENILQGRWAVNCGKAVLALADGQKIEAVCTETGMSAGVINPSDITLSKAKPQEDKINTLFGTVTQMTLERGRCSVLISVETYGTIIKARASLSETEQMSVCPASSVWLSFGCDKIRPIG